MITETLLKKIVITLVIIILGFLSKINAAHSKIDSLNAQKQRIQYVYINKIKEIDNYNAKQLEEYWKNEIK